MESMSSNLADLIGSPKDEIAQELILAFKDKEAISVKATINSYREVWKNKGKNEQDKLKKQADVASRRQDGHRVECPSCCSFGLVVGDPTGIPKREIDDDTIFEYQDYFPNQFQCTACGLKIFGLARLLVCNLGSQYTKTVTYNAYELFSPEDSNRWEDDNNEPY